MLFIVGGVGKLSGVCSIDIIGVYATTTATTMTQIKGVYYKIALTG